MFVREKKLEELTAALAFRVCFMLFGGSRRVNSTVISSLVCSRILERLVECFLKTHDENSRIAEEFEDFYACGSVEEISKLTPLVFIRRNYFISCFC